MNKMLDKLPKGYFIEWSGQYEISYGEKNIETDFTCRVADYFLCMYFAFHSVREAFFSLITVPFALIGGAYMIYFWGVNCCMHH